jgi:RNA polymerase sigma-70 factor (ECF subfamily)
MGPELPGPAGPDPIPEELAPRRGTSGRTGPRTAGAPSPRVPATPGSATIAPDLERLIEQIASGSEAAMAGLYDRTASLIFGLIRRIVRDQQAAEEVTHEVYLQVWRKARDFDAMRGKASTWLLLLARSRALDYLRSSRARRRDAPLELIDGQASDSPGPDEDWARSSTRRTLDAALEELSAPQRQAIACAYYRGLSYTEVAAELGEPVGTIKTRIRLGMTRLRQILEPIRNEG